MRMLTCFVAVGLFLAVGACSKPKEDSAATGDSPVGDAAAAGDREARLAAADALDGEADKVITKCAMCALRMDGSPDHVSQTYGYELRFCRAGCKERFDENVDAALVSLDIRSP